MKLRDLAERLHCRLEGDGDLDITRVAGIEDAGPGDLTFLANPKYAPLVAQTRASAIILGDDAPAAPCAMLRAAASLSIVCRRARACSAATSGRRRHSSKRVVAPDARIGADVSIGPLVVVGAGAEIGDRVVLHPHVVIGPGARIGADSHPSRARVRARAFASSARASSCRTAP